MTTRKDKLDHAIKVFTKLNIPSQFFITKKHKLGGKFGCFHSKYIVVKDAYESGSNTFLMFEDDVIDSEEYSLEKIKECVNFMNKNKDWEIFFLGRGLPLSLNSINIFLNKEEIVPNIFLGIFRENHALAFNRNGMRKFIEYYENNVQNIQENITFSDEIIEELFLDNSYYHKDNLFIQNDKVFTTDNEYNYGFIGTETSNKITDNARNIVSRYTVVKLNDFIALNKIKFLLIIILIILIIIITKFL